MSRVRVNGFGISIDGFSAGPGQDLDHPMGVGGLANMEWWFSTRTFATMYGKDGGAGGADDDFARRSFENVGAWIMGRNMFGPVRGPWPDHAWRGWWGEDPPYHVPVFVLTHHARPEIQMAGGTTFDFVTGGIHDALERARDAAAGRDVRIGGGVATVRAYLRAGLVDEIHLVQSRALLGSGERLFDDLDLPALGFSCTERVAGALATHVVLTRR